MGCCSFSLRSLWREYREQLRISIPTTFNLIIFRLPWLITLHMVGSAPTTTAPQLAAVILATTLTNIMGHSLVVGLSSALTTLTLQARGMARFKFVTGLDADNNLNAINFSFPPIKMRGLNTGGLNNNVAHKRLHLSKEESDSCSEESDERSSDSEDENEVTSSLDSREATNELLFDSCLSLLESATVLPRTYLYRALFLHYAIAISIGSLWLTPGIVQNLLTKFGIGKDVALMAHGYLQRLTPAFWLSTFNSTMVAWFQALGMTYVPAIVALIIAVIHVPINLYFIYKLEMGYIGTAYATVCSQIIQLFILCTYTWGTRLGRDRILRAMGVTYQSRSFWEDAKHALFSRSDALDYLQLALPGIILISQSWASDCIILLAGRFRPINMSFFAVGSMAIYQGINSFFIVFPLGVSTATSARVGSLLGAGDPRGARVACDCAVISAGILCSMIAVIIYFSPRKFLPFLFSSDVRIVEQTARIIPLSCVYLVAGGIQSALSGTIKGCGRQCIAAPIVVASYWFLAIPVSWWLSFDKNSGIMCEDDFSCGVVGLATGLAIGTIMHCFLLFILVYVATDWDYEAHRAHDSIAFERNTNGNKKKLTKRLSLRAGRYFQVGDSEGDGMNASTSFVGIQGEVHVEHIFNSCLESGLEMTTKKVLERI